MELGPSPVNPMLRGAMSLRIGRSFLSGPNIAVSLPRPCSSDSHHRLCRISDSALCAGLSQRKHLSILSFSLTTLLRASIHSTSTSSRAARTHASLARSGAQKTSWDEAADSYFSEERDQETPTPKPPGMLGAFVLMSRRSVARESNDSHSWERRLSNC